MELEYSAWEWLLGILPLERLTFGCTLLCHLSHLLCQLPDYADVGTILSPILTVNYWKLPLLSSDIVFTSCKNRSTEVRSQVCNPWIIDIDLLLVLGCQLTESTAPKAMSVLAEGAFIHSDVL